MITCSHHINYKLQALYVRWKRNWSASIGRNPFVKNMMNNIFGSSIWQPLDLASTDEHPTWWNVAASLSSDIIQLRMIQGKDDHDHEDIENNNDRHKKLCFNNIPLRNLSVKLQYHQPAADHKWYKTLPPGEMLPRNETLGGYIFVCNNETMQEDLRRQLFGKLKHIIFSCLIFIVFNWYLFFKLYIFRASTEI